MTAAAATTEELLAIGDRLVSQASPNEQLEVVIAIEHDTEVRAYGGEVEAYSSGQIHGRRHPGYQRPAPRLCLRRAAWTEAVLAETLAEARDNVSFATPDEYLGLAEHDATPYATLDLHDPGMLEHSPEEKIQLALELEQAVLKSDSRIIGRGI